MKECLKLFVVGDKHGCLESPLYKKFKFDIIPQEKPDITCINGDWTDFNYFSSHGASVYNVQTMRDEIESTIDDLAFIRSKSKRVHYNFGNHEFRLFSIIQKFCPQLLGVESVGLHEILKLEKLKITWSDYNPRQCFRPWSDERLAIMHKPVSSGVNCAMTSLGKSFASVIFNHTHRAQHVVLRDIFGEKHFSISNGCMCDINHDAFNYMPSKNDWNVTFTRVIKTSKGMHAELFAASNDQFIVDGKTYE